MKPIEYRESKYYLDIDKLKAMHSLDAIMWLINVAGIRAIDALNIKVRIFRGDFDD